MSDVTTTDAYDMYVTVYDDGEFIGAGMSGRDAVEQKLTGNGEFVAILFREPAGPTEVWAWPLVFDDKTGLPAMAVAKLANTDVIDNSREATDYWAWGKDTDHTNPDMGTWTIKENEYSGAIHIFSWIDWGLLRTADGISDDQMTVAVFGGPKTGTPSFGPWRWPITKGRWEPAPYSDPLESLLAQVETDFGWVLEPRDVVRAAGRPAPLQLFVDRLTAGLFEKWGTRDGTPRRAGGSELGRDASGSLGAWPCP